MAESREGRQPAAPSWRASELGLRVGSALVLGLTALFATAVGGPVFAVLWLAAGGAIAFEWLIMARVGGGRPLAAALCLALAALSLATQVATSGWLVMAATAAALLAAAALNARWRDRLWAAGGFGYAAVIVVVPPVVRDHPRLGIAAILWMFAVVWATDVAAYFTGRRFGGPKLWPSISPKKTWSGFAGGLGAGTAAGLAVGAVAPSFGGTAPLGLAGVALLSALASVMSQAGDLAESWMKRRFDVKDSGRLIPGHGGVMDRLDGFWAVAALVGLLVATARP